MIVFYLLSIPIIGACLLAFLGHKYYAAELNIFFSGLSFLTATYLALTMPSQEVLASSNQFFLIDPLNAFLIVLTSFIGCSTAFFSRSYMRIEQNSKKLGLSQGKLKLYHSMYQLFSFSMLLALLANNLGIVWVAMEGATLTTVLLVSLYRTPAALAAAWKYFILCGVGIAQALFGTILLYFAAEKILGPGGTALLWTELNGIKYLLEPHILELAFVFLLVGYGTKVGLVPLHNWLPDAHAEGPTPISAVLSGLLLNVALYVILRCKVLVDGALNSPFAGQLMMGFGLLTVVVAAFSLFNQKDIKRLFGYSSIEHMGLITFALGLNSTIATIAAFLHLTVHSLTKSAIFFSVGHITQKNNSQLIINLRGLLQQNPALAWSLLFGSFAILGMPPFGLFASEFMILTTTFQEAPWALIPLFIALSIAFAAIVSHIPKMAFGSANKTPLLTYRPSILPIIIHLSIVLILGLFIPEFLQDWYQHAAKIMNYGY